MPNARPSAAVVLARSSLAGAVPSLRQALGDGFWQVQKEAALALGEIRATPARSALLPLLADPHVDVRKAARLALAAIDAEGPLAGSAR